MTSNLRQLLAGWVLERYGSNPQLLLLLKQFLDTGNFEVVLDDGQNAITVPPELLPHLRDGTKLVMRVVTFQRASSKQTTVPCPSCGKNILMDMRASERVFWCVDTGAISVAPCFD
jgi:DNA-directed RNA polymerase subunit RPC12/RpoP